MSKPKYVYIIVNNKWQVACERAVFTNKADAIGYCAEEAHWDPKGFPHRALRIRTDLLEEVKP